MEVHFKSDGKLMEGVQTWRVAASFKALVIPHVETEDLHISLRETSLFAEPLDIDGYFLQNFFIPILN